MWPRAAAFEEAFASMAGTMAGATGHPKIRSVAG